MVIQPQPPDLSQHHDTAFKVQDPVRHIDPVRSRIRSPPGKILIILNAVGMLLSVLILHPDPERHDLPVLIVHADHIHIPDKLVRGNVRYVRFLLLRSIC